jgi:hypothetical protein
VQANWQKRVRSMTGAGAFIGISSHSFFFQLLLPCSFQKQTLPAAQELGFYISPPISLFEDVTR